MKPDNVDTVSREKSHSFFKRFQEYANQTSGSSNGIRRTSSLTALEDLSNSKLNLKGRHRRTHRRQHKQEIPKSKTMSVEELDVLGTKVRNNNIQRDFEELKMNTDQLSSGNSSEFSDEREFRTPRQRQNNVLNNYADTQNTGLMRYHSTGTLDKGGVNQMLANGGVIGVKKRHVQQRTRSHGEQDQKVINNVDGGHKGQIRRPSGERYATSKPTSPVKPRHETISYIPRSRSLMELRNERSGSFSNNEVSSDRHHVQTSSIPRRTFSQSTDNLSASLSSSTSFSRGLSDRRSERTTSSSDYTSSGSASSKRNKWKQNSKPCSDNTEISRSTEHIASEDLSRWNKMKIYDHNRRQHTMSESEDVQKRSASSMRATEESTNVEKAKSKDRVRSAEYSSAARRNLHSSTREKHADKENIPQNRSRTRRALPQLPNANSKEVEERRKRISAIALERVQRGLHALRKEVKEELDTVNYHKDTTEQSQNDTGRLGSKIGTDIVDIHDENTVLNHGAEDSANMMVHYHPRDSNRRIPEKTKHTYISNHMDTMDSDESLNKQHNTSGTTIVTLEQDLKTTAPSSHNRPNNSADSFLDKPQMFSKSMDSFHSKFGHIYPENIYDLKNKHDETLSMTRRKEDKEINEHSEQRKGAHDGEAGITEKLIKTDLSNNIDDTSPHNHALHGPYIIHIDATEEKPSLRSNVNGDSTTDLSNFSKSHSREEFGSRDDISKDAIQKLIHDLRDAANKPINDTNSASHSSIHSVTSRDHVSSPEVSQINSKGERDSGNDSNSSQSCSNNQSLMQTIKSNSLTVDLVTEETASSQMKPQNRPSLHKISQTCDFVSLSLTFEKGASFTSKFSLTEAPYYEAESAKGGKFIIKPPVGRRQTIGASGAFAPVSTNATPTSVDLNSDIPGLQLCLVAVEVKGQDCFSFKENHIWDGDFLIEINEEYVANLAMHECLEHLNQPSSSLSLVVARPKTHPGSTSKGENEAEKECEKLKFKFDSMKEEAERNLDAIADLRCAIKEKDNHIRHLEEKYRNHHGHHDALEDELKEKDAKVMEWMLEVNRRDIELSRLKVQLKLKEDKITQLRKLLIQQTELMQLQGLNGCVNQPDYEMDGEKVSAV